MNLEFSTLDSHDVYTFGFQNPKSQAAIFIYQLLKKHEIKNESFELAKRLMKMAIPFYFAYEINRWIRTGKTNEDKIFSVEQYQQLGRCLIDRALEEADDMPIFEKFPNNNHYLLPVWDEIDHVEFYNYIHGILDKTPKKVLDLLRAFTPTMMSSSHPSPYKSDFSEEQFDFFVKLFDKEYIFEKVNSEFGEEINKEDVKFVDMVDTQTDLNILRQFNHWYEKKKENTQNV